MELLQLNGEHAEQLKWIMLGEISKKKKEGIKYRVNETNGEEIILLPTEWLTADDHMSVKEGVKELVD